MRRTSRTRKSRLPFRNARRSHRAPAILEALAAMPSASIRVDVLAPNSLDQRERSVARSGYDLAGLALHHHVGDPTVAADLAPLNLGTYTNVLLVATTQASGAASDARTIYAYVLLRDLLDESGLTEDAAPTVLIELTDEDNAVLYDDDPAEVILSPLMVSHMLAHVALRRELLPVYETLFQAGGPQLRFRSAARYGLTGRPVGVDVRRHAAEGGVPGRAAPRRAWPSERRPPPPAPVVLRRSLARRRPAGAGGGVKRWGGVAVGQYFRSEPSDLAYLSSSRRFFLPRLLPCPISPLPLPLFALTPMPPRRWRSCWGRGWERSPRAPRTPW
ncbi:MAG: hypothetical protein AAGF99_07340 [Bacteroidota bacterium]